MPVRDFFHRLVGREGEARPSPVRLYYFNPWFRKNVGDQLNVSLIRRMTGRPVASCSPWLADHLCIGSLLDTLLRERGGPVFAGPPLTVWGAGFIAAPGRHPYVRAAAPECFARPVVFRAVRGRHTLARIKAMGFTGDDVVLGDPGLLVGLIAAAEPPPKRFALGLVPHYMEAADPVWRQVRARLGDVRILRVADPPERFVAEMRECETIISSAMHGLIMADGLGIPNLRARVSDRLIGGDFKFADYYSVYGVAPEPLSAGDLRGLTRTDVDRIRSSYAIPAEAVRGIAAALLDRSPFASPPEGRGGD